MALSLASSAFAEGKAIPRRHTCDGENSSPPLRWSGVPRNAKSLALICSDPDAPAGTWYHWAIFDIAPDTDGLEAGVPPAARHQRAWQAINDFKKVGYGGPCPPRGHGAHRYRFRLMALDVADLTLPPGAGCRDVERAVDGHVIAESTLTGTYGRA